MVSVAFFGSLLISSPRWEEVFSTPLAYVWLESHQLWTPPAAADIGAWWAGAERKTVSLLLHLEKSDIMDAVGPHIKCGPSRCKFSSINFLSLKLLGITDIFWNLPTSAAGFRRIVGMILPIETDNPSALKWKIINALPIYFDPRKNGPRTEGDFKV